jgi:molecular chaperone GrpE (heat shock protein)
MNNVLYFVEGLHSASLSHNGLLSLEPFEQKITINEVKKSLEEFNLTERKTFKDVYEFNNENLILEVVLKSKDNFYDDKETDVKDLNYYVQLVEFIEVTLQKTLKKTDLNIIEKIMKTFNLNIYHIETLSRCKNKDELIKLLVKIGY